MAEGYEISLDITDQSGPVSRLKLSGEHIAIGRASDSQICLNRTTVSRKHAEIHCDPLHRWWIKDSGSRNGTFVNGQLIKDLHHPIRLGDILGVGEFSLRVTALSGSHAYQPPMVQPAGAGVRQPVGVGAGEGGVVVSETTSAEISSLQEYAPPKIASSHLSILNEFGQRLLVMDDAAGRLRELCRLMVRDEFLGRCAMVLRVLRGEGSGDGTEFDQPRVVSPAEVSPRWRGWDPYVSRTLLRAVAAKEEPLLASNVPSYTGSMASDISLSPEVMAIAAIACPVRSDAQSQDVLYVVMPPECGTSEWLALAALATKQYQQSELVIAAREHAAVERELKKAMEIQSRLVPRNPALSGIELAIGFKPCRWVGGDYVDAVKTADGRTLLVMADVCGKGLPAALVASMLHTTVRVGVKAGMDLTQMMQNLNDYLRESMFEQSFVTMVSILADPVSGEVECVNAGHPPAVLIDPAGKMRALQAGANLPLGVGDEPLEANRDVVAPGELLVLYTDGLADLADECGTRLGSDKLSRMLCEMYAKEHASDVTLIGQRLTEMLDEYQGETVSPDDRTFLLGRRVNIS